MLELRVLGSDDFQAVEAFLIRHRDTSMFLRSNAREAGLVYRGQRQQAVYLGGFRAGELVGVVAHAWNGLLLFQAPEEVDAIVRACVDASRRAVVGLIGPGSQVRQARRSLGLEGAPSILEEDEDLYVLDLAGWGVPEAVPSAGLECRAPVPAEYAALRSWRVAYEVEALGRSDDAVLRRQAANAVDAQISDQVAWVAVANGVPVSFAAFNAALPDIVQLGGVYTPPEFRGRSYAKAVVAHAVLVGRERGAGRAVLFTGNPNAARAYQALGFTKKADFALVLFK